MQNLQMTERIKLRAKQKGISIKYLLEKCGINKGFIYDIEKQNKIPSVDKIERIADCLDCSVDYLLGRTDVIEINSSAVNTENNNLKFYNSFVAVKLLLINYITIYRCNMV